MGTVIKPAFDQTVVKFGVGSRYARVSGIEYADFLADEELRRRIEGEGLRLFEERNGFEAWDDVEDGKYVRVLMMESIAEELVDFTPTLG